MPLSDPAATLAAMDLAAKVRQVIMPALRLEMGDSLPERITWGGYIIVPMPAANLTPLIAVAQARALIPLFIGADVEVGAAQSVEGATMLPTAMAIAATGDPANARAVAAHTAMECRAMGINWAFAPVADINSQPLNPIINVRAFGDLADRVSDYVQASVAGFQDGGVMATAKHFPGHGDTHRDSHIELPLVTADRDTLHAREFVPFRAAVAAGVGSIMTAHLGLPAYDAPTIPATFSRPIITDLLREELGFGGIVVTDALIMGGVTASMDGDTAAVQAILAGCDVLLAPIDPEATALALEQAVLDGILPIALIDASVGRILAAKARFVAPQTAPTPIAWSDLLASGQALSRRIADAAVTVLWDRRSMLPLPTTLPVTTLTMVDRSGASNYWMSLLIEAGCADVYRLEPTGDSAELATALADVTGPVLVTICAIAAPWQGLAGWAPHFLEPLRALARRVPLGLVLLGSPYLADAFPEAAMALCTYAFGLESQQAALAVLHGRQTARGRCPIRLAGADDVVSLRESTPEPPLHPRR